MTNIAALASGGVDSSVSIYLLKEMGYNPDMFYIKIGMEDMDTDYSCTQEEDLEMATAVAHKFGLKLNVVDLQKEYFDNVVSYVIKQVKRGLTPNPDVMCNRLIKFGAFNDKVGKDYDKIMTGHYARVIEKDGKCWLGTAPDPVKDQTDFLAQIDTWQLNKAMFPIGDLSKQQVRDIAEKINIAPAHRKDSQGICFLGKINYNDFIEKYLGKLSGDIVEYETGKIVGKHNGYWFHTIGQRRGLGLSGGPWYVCKKDITNNIVYVTTQHDFTKLFDKRGRDYRNDFIFLNTNIHWITEKPFPNDNDICWQNGDNPEITFKIRHSPEFHTGTMHNLNGTWWIKTNENIGGIAPGQFCVIYDKDHKICYGSGEIQL